MIKTISARIIIMMMTAFMMTQSALAQKIIVVDGAEVLSKSKVGKHIQTQLKSIEAQMKSEIEALRKPIAKEQKAIEGQTKNMKMSELKTRPDLTKRINDLQIKAKSAERESAYKSQEIGQTSRVAMTAVAKKVDEILNSLAAEKGADVILDRSTTIYMSPKVDMTQTVISRLNKQMPTTPVNRVRIPRKK